MTREDRQRIGVAALIFAAGLGFALCFCADDDSDSAAPARPTKASEAYEAMAHWYGVTDDGRDHPWDVPRTAAPQGAAPRSSVPQDEAPEQTTPRTFAESSPEPHRTAYLPDRPPWLTAEISDPGYGFSPR